MCTRTNTICPGPQGKKGLTTRVCGYVTKSETYTCTPELERRRHNNNHKKQLGPETVKHEHEQKGVKEAVEVVEKKGDRLCSDCYRLVNG